MVFKLGACLQITRRWNSDSVSSPRVSGSLGVGWGLRVCISTQFPGDAAAAALGMTPGEALLQWDCGFSNLRGRNGIQEQQRLDVFLKRCLLNRDRINAVIPGSHRVAVVTRVFGLVGTCGSNRGVPGIEIDGVLSKVLLGVYRGVMGGLPEPFQRTGTCEDECRVR